MENNNILIISASMRPMAGLLVNSVLWESDLELSIFSQMEDISRKSGVKLNDVKTLLIDIGPGSFTGMRIACAIGKAFGLLGATLFTFSSLDVLADMSGIDGEFYVYMDAKRNNFYIARYRKTPSCLSCCDDPKLLSYRQLPNDLPKFELNNNYTVKNIWSLYVKYPTIFKSVLATELLPLYIYPMDCSVK